MLEWMSKDLGNIRGTRISKVSLSSSAGVGLSIVCAEPNNSIHMVVKFIRERVQQDFQGCEYQRNIFSHKYCNCNDQASAS